MARPQAIILGCGVAGLTCGVVLAERGWGVRVVAEKHWRACASGKAGGLWLPYRIEPRDRVLAWSRRSFEMLVDLARDPANGVLLHENVELYRDPAEARAVWWRSAVPECRDLSPHELPAGYSAGFAARVPVMDVPVYMPALERRLASAGGTIEITGAPVESLDALTGPGHVLLNCTGLGARRLCDDGALYPIRGQLVRMANPGLGRSIADEHHPLGIAYVIARSSDCILGGTADPRAEDESIDPAARARILRANLELEPRLRGAPVLEDVACLRPFRSSVRLERARTAAGHRVVHNYGHGGAGYTVSWGCAEEAAALAAGA